MTQITSSLVGKRAAIVGNLITSQPYAAVESVKTCRQHKGSRPLDEELDRGEDSDEKYVVSNIAVVTLDGMQLVMLRLRNAM